MNATLSPETDLNVFIGRQPIFDSPQRVFGYELLYRSNNKTNAYSHDDGDQATRRVLHGGLNVVGLHELTHGKRAFVNITRKLLINEDYAVLPKETCVVELLETVEPDAEVIAACKQLKRAGYTLALDDFVFDPKYKPLLALADILKIDFLLSDASKRKFFADNYGKKIELLAEKVETQQDFHQAIDLGYRYFQGYFFCKPEIISRREIPALQQNCLRFLQEISAPAINYDRVEEIIKHEMSLSTKLLKYLNSAALGLSQKITSIRQAMALMGEKPLRKWAMLVAAVAIGQDKPLELITTALVRARFCESIAQLLNRRDQELNCFLVGLFSVMDALLDQSMTSALAQINLPPEVVQALIGTGGPLSQIYQLAVSLERAQWTRVQVLAKQLNLAPKDLTECYTNALTWADALSF